MELVVAGETNQRGVVVNVGVALFAPQPLDLRELRIDPVGVEVRLEQAPYRVVSQAAAYVDQDEWGLGEGAAPDHLGNERRLIVGVVHQPAAAPSAFALRSRSR